MAPMANLTKWTLSPALADSYHCYLQYITEPRKDKLYYTKYIVDIVGELDISNDSVREWAIPPALCPPPTYNPNSNSLMYAGSATHITYAPNDNVWVALEEGCRLIELNPNTGLLTAYFGDYWPSYPFPFWNPRHLMFDGAGQLWYTGLGQTGGLIGRLSKNKKSATYWEMVGQLNLGGLWVHPSGDEVWFTPNNGGALLGYLDVLGNKVTYWSSSAPHLAIGRNTGVVGDTVANQKLTNIWFARSAWGSSSRVFRFHLPNLPSQTFFEYAPTVWGGPLEPHELIVDNDRNAWISDWFGKVSMVARNANCGVIPLQRSNPTNVKRVTMGVNIREHIALATPHPAPPTVQPVNREHTNCYLYFPVYLLAQGIKVDSAWPVNVYFAEGSGDIICRLTP